MIARTSITIEKPAREIWPLLCNSRMDSSKLAIFYLGVPKPVECKLASSIGGMGAKRQCISDQGIIDQRITDWDENRHLAFEMENTDIYFGACVSEKDDFVLEEFADEKTRLTRTTNFQVDGCLSFPKSLMIWVGLKTVHQYVFRNWARMEL